MIYSEKLYRLCIIYVCRRRVLQGELRRKKLETAVDPVDNKPRPDTRAEQSANRRRRVSPVPSRAGAVRLLHFAARVPVDGGPRDALERGYHRFVVDHGLHPAVSHRIFKVQSIKSLSVL
jgi:hypothetical protein